MSHQKSMEKGRAKMVQDQLKERNGQLEQQHELSNVHANGAPPAACPAETHCCRSFTLAARRGRAGGRTQPAPKCKVASAARCAPHAQMRVHAHTQHTIHIPLLATCLPTSHWSLVTRVTSPKSPRHYTYYSLLTILTTHYSLLTTYYTHYSVLTAVPTTHSSVITPHYALISIHYSPPTTHHSQHTTHVFTVACASLPGGQPTAHPPYISLRLISVLSFGSPASSLRHWERSRGFKLHAAYMVGRRA